MKYIWIWILVGIDIIWLIASIVDVVKTVKNTNINRYETISDYIGDIITDLEEYTIGFIAVNLFVLFCVSLFMWISSNAGGEK